MTGLIAPLLGAGLFGAELYGTEQLPPLDPEEAQLVAGAAPKRRQDFAAGRACAHAALAQMGRDEGPIKKGEDGRPLWPDGIVGSITHTGGYAAALVGLASDFRGVGLDAEQVGRVTPDLWPRLFDAAERDGLARLPDPLGAATLLFSAKEACHKAGQERVLRFRDLRIMLGKSSFTARRPGETFAGRYALAGGLVLVTACRV